MNDNVMRQQRRFMAYNLVAFTLIFALFSFILYSQIRSSLYSPVEQALQSGRQNILNSEEYVARQLSFQTGHPVTGGAGSGDKRDNAIFPGGPSAVPMRIQAIIRDQEGTVLNPQALGRIYFDGYLDQVPYAGAEAREEITAFSLDTSTYYTLTFQKQTKDGQTYQIQLISNVDGEKTVVDNFVRLLVLCTIVFILLSITASYVLSKKTMDPLIKSWKRQTEFVEDASHELRTPLTIIQNKMETMLTKPQSTVVERAEEIGVVLSETRRLSKLTADLMTLARADSSETQLKKESLNLDQLIETVSEPYAELAQLQEKQMKLQLNCPQQILADRGRIHQLMVILLDNALKYTAPGDSICIRTAIRENRVVLEVTDTGIGIAAENRERIFDRFYRADKARNRETGGSGLGLSIAKWIVDSHDGSISATQGDLGTVFQVKLKL